MKKIIAGKMYNTETAKRVAKYESTYGITDFHWFREVLYKKKTNEFFCTVRAMAPQLMRQPT